MTQSQAPRRSGAHRPPMHASDEAKPRQLDLARRQGDATAEAVREMTRHEAHDGGEQRAGDYLVGYAVEEAEGMYQLKDGELVWHEPPAGANCHIEIAVRDGADGRFIPGLEIEVTVHGPDGAEVGRHRHPFLWHPWLYHYGRNWEVPADGDYRLTVRIAPPTFMRHDKTNGRRYAEPVELVFQGVQIKRGRKQSTVQED